MEKQKILESLSDEDLRMLLRDSLGRITKHMLLFRFWKKHEIIWYKGISSLVVDLRLEASNRWLFQ